MDKASAIEIDFLHHYASLSIYGPGNDYLFFILRNLVIWLNLAVMQFFSSSLAWLLFYFYSKIPYSGVYNIFSAPKNYYCPFHVDIH